MVAYNPSAVIKSVLCCVYVDRFPERNVSCSFIMELSKIIRWICSNMTAHTLQHAWQCSMQCELKLVHHKFEYRIRLGELSWKQKLKNWLKLQGIFSCVIDLGKGEMYSLKKFSSVFQMPKTFFSNCFCYFCDLFFFTTPCFKTHFKYHCFLFFWVLELLHFKQELK